MEEARRRYLSKGLASGTRKAYSAGQRRYLDFCERAGITGLPTNENTLCLFAAALAEEGLLAATIRAYLSAVRNLHVEEGLGDPLTPRPPRLSLVVRGIQREQAERGAGGGDTRLPFDEKMLECVREEWKKSRSSYESAMLWAAVCVGFFGCLRTAEFLVSTPSEFRPHRNLTASDVAVDNRQDPTWARLHIKFSKTDQFGEGAYVFLGREHAGRCPVAALLQYMARRGAGEGPLFQFPRGDPLTPRHFAQAIRSALTARGMPADRVSGHSLRIGAATAAARSGKGEEAIRALGRWKSNSYKRYIRLASAGEPGTTRR